MAASSTERFPPAVFLLNLWPLAHVIGVGLLWQSPLLALALLYLLPPVLGRIVIAFAGRPQGRFSVRSREFLVWWTLACLQTIFVRLPFLEELLKLIPLAYSNWLRLWGSRVGRMVYWAPGITLLDRSYLQVGDRVVVGAGSKLCPHYQKDNALVVAPITLGSGSQIGGYAMLTPGVVIACQEPVPATLRIRPFSLFERGRVIRRGAMTTP